MSIPREFLQSSTIQKLDSLKNNESYEISLLSGSHQGQLLASRLFVAFFSSVNLEVKSL